MKKKKKKKHRSDETIVYYIGGNMRVNSARIPPEAMALGQIEKCSSCSEDTIVSKQAFKNVSAACFNSGRNCRVLCDQCQHKVKLDVAIEIPSPLDPEVQKIVDTHNKREFQNRQREMVERMRTAARKGQIPPDTFEVAMYHDDWCDLLSQKGPCNCTPSLGKPKPLIDPSGN